MRAIIQRVRNASVSVDGVECGRCGYGFLILLGIGQHDTEAEAESLWNKILKLRVFPDDDKPTGRSLADIDGEVLVISQFTLYADCRKGNRPSFSQAGSPESSRLLYDCFVELAARDVRHVGSGEFGADMQVALVNDGPFTIALDTDELARPRRQNGK